MQNSRARDRADVTAIHPAPRHVTREEIARRAYEIYCQRSRRDGGDIDDWLTAERECADACAPLLSVRLRIKADRRQWAGAHTFFDRRRKT